MQSKNRLVSQLILLIIFANSYFAFADNTDSLLNILKDAKGNKKVETLIDISHLYRNTDLDKSLTYGKNALELAQKLKDEEKIGKSYNSIALSYDMMGKYEIALDYYYKSLDISKKIKSWKGTTSNLGNIGIIYKNLGQYDKALECYYEALEISTKNNWKPGMVSDNINIAIIFQKLKKYDKSLEYYKLAEELAIAQKDTFRIAVIQTNLAFFYKQRDDIRKAIKYSIIALDILKKLNHTEGMIKNYIFLSDCYLKLKVNDKAEKFLKEGLKLSKKYLKDYYYQVFYNNLSEVNILQGNLTEAIRYKKMILEIKPDGKLQYNLKEIYKDIADLYRQSGNYKSSLEYYQYYTEIIDSVFSESNSLKLAEMEALYESEKKNNEIKQLKIKQKLKEIEVENANFNRNFLIIFSIILLVLIT